MTRKEEKSQFVRHLIECLPGRDREHLETVARLLYIDGATLARLYEIDCSEKLSEAQQETHDRRKKDIEDRVTRRLNDLGLTFEFNDDPRGYAIKVKLPNGRNNNWGGDWGI